ncbi:peptide deformylase [Buchnera aphidicola]|uniref:peptide deformylase n=1 Tax=Buchnera aphidicola TaxID=9 RepID=UPI003463B2D4
MSLLKIIKYPDNRLRNIAQPVKIINKKIHQIIQDMYYTMYEKQGIGLAATQVGINLQIIVIDISEKQTDPIILINPKKIYCSEKISIEEGCLSIPNTLKKITRANKIQIQTLNYYGKKIIIEAKELLSICIQHEMDHLVGKLIIDY